MTSVKVHRFGSRLIWKSYYDEEMPPQLFPVIDKVPTHQARAHSSRLRRSPLLACADR